MCISITLRRLGNTNRVWLRLNLVSRDRFGRTVPQMLTHRLLPPALLDGVHLYRLLPSGQSRVYRVTQVRTNTVNRHRISPAFIGSRNCVPMAFTTEESPPAFSACIKKNLDASKPSEHALKWEKGKTFRWHIGCGDKKSSSESQFGCYLFRYPHGSAGTFNMLTSYQ